MYLVAHAYQEDRADLNRMATVVLNLADPLKDYPTLLAYARGMARYARGDETGALTHLKDLLPPGSTPTAAGIPLPLPALQRGPADPDPTPPPDPKRRLVQVVVGCVSLAVVLGGGHWLFEAHFRRVVPPEVSQAPLPADSPARPPEADLAPDPYPADEPPAPPAQPPEVPEDPPPPAPEPLPPPAAPSPPPAAPPPTPPAPAPAPDPAPPTPPESPQPSPEIGEGAGSDDSQEGEQPGEPPAGEPDPDGDDEIVAIAPSDDEDADEPIDVPGNAPGETEPGTPDVPANPDPEPPSDPPADEPAPRTTLDLSQLVSSFNAGDWQQADEETYRLLLEAADADESNWLSVGEVEAMSCTDLRAIDREWVEASDGKFGFSVQARIWQEVGSPTEYNEQWEEFGDRVGWRVNDRWISSNEVTFDTSSPEGHLPWGLGGGYRRGVGWVGGFGDISSLPLRSVNCSI